MPRWPWPPASRRARQKPSAPSQHIEGHRSAPDDQGSEMGKEWPAARQCCDGEGCHVHCRKVDVVKFWQCFTSDVFGWTHTWSLSQIFQIWKVIGKNSLFFSFFSYKKVYYVQWKQYWNPQHVNSITMTWNDSEKIELRNICKFRLCNIQHPIYTISFIQPNLIC